MTQITTNRLEGKIALVTGGNSGIGLASATRFKQEGAKVIITARSEASYAKAKEELGDQFDIIKTDITKNEELSTLFSYIEKEYGRLDVLFANAGVAYFTPLEYVDEDHFDSLFNTNVKGLYFTVQKASPLLSKGASVILNTSGMNSKGSPNSSVYAATKAAVRSFARSLSSELLTRGIRVNAVSPGPTETPIFGKTGLTEEQLNGFAEDVARVTPIGRFAKPEELANVALFLASDESSYVLGSEFVADGGYSQL
jgi:NAD(P)-dependent dehydrogenase (short-subunit alcohol dehydrogenase family)